VSARGRRPECVNAHVNENGRIVLVKWAVAAVFVTLASVAPGHAQSFGRNKVRYENFDFQILETPHFAVYYDSSDREAAVQAGRLAERWYARLSKTLAHTFVERQPVVLYASHAQFTQTNIIPGLLGDGVGGATEHDKGRVVLPFLASLGETDHVLGHELVHAFQRDILKRTGPPMSTLPLWFVEGMAEFLSVGQIDANTAMWLRDSIEQNTLPRLDQLDDPAWFPYRYGQALWVYLAQRFGDDVVAKSLTSKAPGGAIGIIAAVTGVDARELSSAWHDFIRETVGQSPHARTESSGRPSPGTPAATSAAAVLGGRNGGRLNVGPALSPDGQAIALFSDRSRHSIDMVVADTRTGAVRRTIMKTEGDSHFESLQFIESAGAWDPGGHRLAMAALSGGAPVLTILNAASGSVERELPIRHANQVFSPTWSPDGTQIALSVLHNGFSDLQIVDLETGAVRSLTSDAYADLQPSWSPDGRTIAFSTDRFSSSIETLTFGDFRLASVDVASGTIRALPSIPHAKNIDPHWAQDGRSLFFVADAEEASNIYRLDLAAGEIFKVTDVSTGVSGVTALSPALSVAAGTNQLAFSVYRHGAYEIQLMDGAGGSQQFLTSAGGDDDTSPNDLPAAATTAERAVAGTATPTAGLLDSSQFTTKPYRPGLSLDRVVQPYLTAGGSGSGSFLRGGVSLSFGDMLGDHAVQTALQVGKSSSDFAAQVSYLNMRSRWTWGILTSQVPWLTSSSVMHGSIGSPTVTQETELHREVHRQLLGAAIYPFSSTRRLELSAGLQTIGFKSQTLTSEYSGITGRLMNESTVTHPAGPIEFLSESRAALVYDTAIFGPTSPTLGRRYRFAVAPTFGGLTFTTVTADYRQYWMPIRPFTVAIRLMHLGRYGADANDTRLLPLVWTIRDIVRGYGDFGTGSTPLGSLSASQIVVANGEVRFPITGLFTQRPRVDALPIEGLVFSDMGQFATSPAGISPSKAGLRSAGAGARLNAVGMIFELDAVRRFDAPRGWAFSFNLRPGF